MPINNILKNYIFLFLMSHHVMLIPAHNQNKYSTRTKLAIAAAVTTLGIGAGIYCYQRYNSSSVNSAPDSTTDSAIRITISDKPYLLEQTLKFMHAHHQSKNLIPNWEAILIAQPIISQVYNHTAPKTDDQSIINATLVPSSLENTDYKALAQVLRFSVYHGPEITWKFISDLYKHSTIPTQQRALAHLCSISPLQGDDLFCYMGLSRFLPIVRNKDFEKFLSPILSESDDFIRSGARGYRYYFTILRDSYRKKTLNATKKDPGLPWCEEKFVKLINQQRRLNYLPYLRDSTSLPEALFGVIMEFLSEPELEIESEQMFPRAGQYALVFTNQNDLTVADILAAHRVVVDKPNDN